IAEVASNPQPGQKLTFDISGEGTLQDQSQNASNQPGEEGSAAADNRPGGGLGRPIEAPDPLEKSALQGQGAVLSYRVITLVGLGLLLFGGAVWTVRRSGSAGPAAAASTTPLLDALKEELFRLEMEHKRGEISDQDYASAKAALDQTL